MRKKGFEKGSFHLALTHQAGDENFIDVRTSNVQKYSKSNPTSYLVYSGGYNLPTS
ncbi:hypothetical protein B7P43_G07096 [Cryptotermes secundus]|uniref:Uncharacterized protein n=1 Tax=Cryptotermes secundus TaxID=105785 RepID=A0A2J7PD82_9NEOP|nr:hypothetical protein B7P43_G07096 [Cryptotermes secundus]